MSAALWASKLFRSIPSRIQTHNYFRRPDPYSGAVIQLRFMGTHLGYESNIRFLDLESSYTSNYATETLNFLWKSVLGINLEWFLYCYPITSYSERFLYEYQKNGDHKKFIIYNYTFHRVQLSYTLLLPTITRLSAVEASFYETYEKLLSAVFGLLTSVIIVYLIFFIFSTECFSLRMTIWT